MQDCYHDGRSLEFFHWTLIPTVEWTGTIQGVTELYEGLKIAYKIPNVTGGNTATTLNINGLGAKYVIRCISNTTTHLPANTIVNLTYDGNYWKWADYDSNTNNWVTSMGAYCDTAAATAAKVATSTNHVYTAGETFLIRFTVTNTAASKITLNINSQGAKDVWINGAVSSASNYNIPYGEHWCHYDGSVFHIWTDGTAQFKNVAAKSYKGLEYTDGENLVYQYVTRGSPNTTPSADNKSITISPQDRDTYFGIKFADDIDASETITVAFDVEYTGDDDGQFSWSFKTIGQAGGVTIFVKGSGHYTATGLAGNSVTKDSILWTAFDDLGRLLPTNSFTIKNFKIERGGTATGFCLCKVEQMDTTPTASSTNAVTSGGIKTALDAKANGVRWTAVTKGQTWSRLFYSSPVNYVEGSSGILAVSCTGGNVVCNATFLITASHNGANHSTIIELASCNYTQVRSRLVVHANGHYYFEVYDTANSITSSTTQTWHCTFVPLLGANITTYTEFTDGTTIPSGYAETNDFKTTGGHGAAAIKNITRSGTTFTATRQDGSTFTFTQQDSTDKVSRVANTTLNDDVSTTWVKWGRKLTVDGKAIYLDMSTQTGGWAGAFAGLTDASASYAMVGFYGQAGTLNYTYMMGTYSDPAFKITTSGIATFKNSLRVPSLTSTDGNRTYTLNSTKGGELALAEDKLDKTTYEWNKEIAFGSTGKLCVGKFPMHDSNVTITISSTTSTSYYGVIVIATQNINTSRGGTYTVSVYGDPSGYVATNLAVKYSSGSRNFEVYFSPGTWTKNLVHIQANALRDEPTDICTSVDALPTTDLVTVTNKETVTLNGTATNVGSASFYAPTVGGTANYVLIGNGTTSAPTWAEKAPKATTSDTATKASYLTGFTSRHTSNISWGTLTPANGYTTVTEMRYTSGSQDPGAIAFGYKAGSGTSYDLSCQIDGVFYQREGGKRVLDESDLVPMTDQEVTDLLDAMSA